MFAMSERISEQSGETWDAHNIKNPSLGWMIGFLYIVSFLGLFSVVPLRKVRASTNSVLCFFSVGFIRHCNSVVFR